VAALPLGAQPKFIVGDELVIHFGNRHVILVVDVPNET
jgi:hypothetical protein